MSVLGSAVQFLDTVLAKAITNRASDIHFEPFQTSFRVRLRIDGVLHEEAVPDALQGAQVVNRIKVLARLDIAQKRLPQDGRMQYTASQSDGQAKAFDIRVSTLPTLFGEKVVLRILDNSTLTLDWATLGLDAQTQTLLQASIDQPYGMVLVSGPTGSGKTATLYTCLQRLNRMQRNICTVEDPVEIYLHGVNQVHVNEKTGLDFATALRAFLRQDPDVLMLGEMRDWQSADIALKAAQTGHLVLSTLHTNDAPSALTRLRHMGAAGYQIAASVHLVLAQRLLRRLCPHCRQADSIADNGAYFRPNTHGCQYCYQGYCGRIGVFQAMPIHEDLCELIVQDASTQALSVCAKAQGMVSLREAAIQLAQQGDTSLAEVFLHT